MNFIAEYAANRIRVKDRLHDPNLVQQLSLGALERRLAERGVSLFVLPSCAAIGQPDGSFCIDSQTYNITDIVIDAKQICETADALGSSLRQVAAAAVLHESGHILNIKLARAVNPAYLPTDPIQEEERAWFLGREMAESLELSVPYDYALISSYFIKCHLNSYRAFDKTKPNPVPDLETAKTALDKAIQRLERQVKSELAAIAKPNPAVKEHRQSPASRKALTPQAINAAKARRLGITLPDNFGELTLDGDKACVNIPTSVLCFG